MTERPELTIGAFARRCRLPVSTLRYYDRIGLLAPALVDPGTGYRRYTTHQIPAAALIFRLRSLGIPPQGIAGILRGGTSASAVVQHERRRLTTQIETARLRLRQLEELLGDGAGSGYRVEVVALRARRVATLPFRLPVSGLDDGVPRAIARLRSALRRGGQDRCGPLSAVFPVDLADDVRGSVFAAIGGPRACETDGVWLPAASAVATVRRGSVASLPLAYQAVFAAVDNLGGSAAGTVIEEYPGLDDRDAAVPEVRLVVPFRTGA
jgi:DNA-binding transcriptional MerR regulator